MRECVELGREMMEGRGKGRRRKGLWWWWVSGDEEE